MSNNQEINTCRMVWRNKEHKEGALFNFPFKYGKEFDQFVIQRGKRPTLEEAVKWLQTKNQPKTEWTSYLTYPLIVAGIYLLVKERWYLKDKERKNENTPLFDFPGLKT